MKIISSFVVVMMAVAIIINTLMMISPVSAQTITPWVRNVSCVARPNQSEAALAGAIQWACTTGGVDCAPIQPGGASFFPNTTEAHASWAFDMFYRNAGPAGQSQISTCDFGGVAMLQCPQNNPTQDLKKERIIGVCLGGHFVLEPWITPSLFEQFVNVSADKAALDEYGFNKYLGQEEATRQLTQHWETWITETDIMNIKKAGFNTVRLPFGSWILGDQPGFYASYNGNGLKYMDKLINWCEKYDVKVLLDLHGTICTACEIPVISQNGFDNSGYTTDIKGKIAYNPTAPKKPTAFTPDAPDSINYTVSVIRRIALRYKSSPAIWGFELINEPLFINKDILTEFYIKGYQAIREVVGDSWYVIMHNGFYDFYWQQMFTPAQGYTKVVLDTHDYQSFGAAEDFTKEQHLETACGMSRNVDMQQCNEIPTIVGEWSLGYSDCAKWLEGFGQKPRSSKCSERPPNVPYDNEFLAEYGKRQVSAWYRGEGFFFWTWKTEKQNDAAGWDAQYALSQGWLPSFVNGISDEVINYCNFSKV